MVKPVEKKFITRHKLQKIFQEKKQKGKLD